jgi:hypothetical protein
LTQDIPRYLPTRVGRLLVRYLAIVLPFREYLRVAGSHSEWLWTNDQGQHWTSDKVSDILARSTGRHMGLRLTLSAWRHIAIAIDRKHVRGLAKGLEDEEQSDEDDNDLEDPHDLQAGHSTRTANLVYAVRHDLVRGLTDQSLGIFSRVSVLVDFSAPPTLLTHTNICAIR